MVKSHSNDGISAMQPNIDAHNTRASIVTDGIVLHESKCLGYINLRLDNATEKAIVKILTSLFSLALPEIGEVARNERMIILGYSNNEWLIITHPDDEQQLIQQLNKKLANFHHLVTDVSGGTTKLNIAGHNAQDLLEKGTYVDLHHSIFKKNQHYSTLIAHAPAVIVKNDDNDFSLIVRRSFANHIAEWAMDGASEYGVSFS